MAGAHVTPDVGTPTCTSKNMYDSLMIFFPDVSTYSTLAAFTYT